MNHADREHVVCLLRMFHRPWTFATSAGGDAITATRGDRTETFDRHTPGYPRGDFGSPQRAAQAFDLIDAELRRIDAARGWR